MLAFDFKMIRNKTIETNLTCERHGLFHKKIALSAADIRIHDGKIIAIRIFGSFKYAARETVNVKKFLKVRIAKIHHQIFPSKP